jgi:hypothetical protein
MPGLGFLESWLEYHETFSAYSHVCPSPVPPVEDVILPERNTANQKVTSIDRPLDDRHLPQLDYWTPWLLNRADPPHILHQSASRPHGSADTGVPGITDGP